MAAFLAARLRAAAAVFLVIMAGSVAKLQLDDASQVLDTLTNVTLDEAGIHLWNARVSFQVALRQVPYLRGDEDVVFGGHARKWKDVPALAGHRWYEGTIANQPGSHVRLALDGSRLTGTLRTHSGRSALVAVRSGDPLRALPEPRRRRSSGGAAGLSRAACTVELHADKSFFDAWGGSGTTAHRVSQTIVKMVNLLHSADAVFSDPANMGRKLGLVVGGAKVLPDAAFQRGNSPAPASSLLAEYQDWLGAQHAAAAGVAKPCLYQLFTHTALADQTLGSATVGVRTEGAQGGACADAGAGADADGAQTRRKVASNTGVISSLQLGKRASMSAMVQTLVHEIGHSFGARHTCCRGEGCAAGTACDELEGTLCNPSGSKYVMYPLLAAGGNALLFSECSKRSIHNFLKVIDCVAMLHPCSRGGACCDGAALRPQGTMCRGTHPGAPCSKPAFCDGLRPSCPESAAKADGAVCTLPATAGQSGGFGACSNAVCTHTNTPACAKHGPAGSVGCTLPAQPCQPACRRAGAPQCQPLASNCSRAAGGRCSGLVVGMPCVGDQQRPGLCTLGPQGSSRCQPAESAARTASVLPGHAAVYRRGACAWLPDRWPQCTRQCGRGTRTRAHECVCADQTVDETGVHCDGPRPAETTEPCNPAPCPACAFVEVLPLAGAAKGHAFSGWYRLVEENKGVPQLVNERHYFAHDGAKQLFLYSVVAFRRRHWVVGPMLGSSYSWVASVASNASTPTSVHKPWSVAAVSKDNDSTRAPGARLDAVKFRCTCDSHGTALDATGTYCVARAAGDTAPGPLNPESTSTPEVETAAQGHGPQRAASQPHKAACPRFFASGAGGTCVRQHFCTAGLSSLGGACTCGKLENCRTCHLHVSGELRCLERTDSASL